jgi:subtilisin family serine protease
MVNAKYVVKAGTSMATPFVAGVVALLWNEIRSLEPTVIKDCCGKIV